MMEACVPQVQAIGLQVLKGMTQKYTNNEEKVFLLFFVGELIGDVLATIDMVLKVLYFTNSHAMYMCVYIYF